MIVRRIAKPGRPGPGHVHSEHANEPIAGLCTVLTVAVAIPLVERAPASTLGEPIILYYAIIRANMSNAFRATNNSYAVDAFIQHHIQDHIVSLAAIERSPNQIGVGIKTIPFRSTDPAKDAPLFSPPAG